MKLELEFEQMELVKLTKEKDGVDWTPEWGIWKRTHIVSSFNVDPFELIEGCMHKSLPFILYHQLGEDPPLENPPAGSLVQIIDAQDKIWVCIDQRMQLQLGRWKGGFKDRMGEYIILHLSIEVEPNRFDEWRVYQVDPEGHGLPLRITGVRGDAAFIERSGVIQIPAEADRPPYTYWTSTSPEWPRPYLEGWTEVQILRDRVATLCYCVHELSTEKKALEEAIAKAAEELDQLIGPETLKSIRNPLAALLRPNDSCVQHCAEEIKSTLEAVRDRLQPRAE